ncbi:MAG: primase-helicase family protein [Limnohabitans sp.]
MANTTQQSTPLEELQEQFAMIDLSGELRYVDQTQIKRILNGQISGEPAFYKKADATLLMKRALEKLPYPCKPQVVINEFLVAPKTLVYQGTGFTPTPSAPAMLNFWVGPIESDSKGNASLILNHLLQVICSGDTKCFEYLVGYLAHMIQKPAEKPGVMIVLLGRQGTGKGMFFNLLRAIWPRTTLQVTDVDQVVGRFNACLERNFAVCMDEALFAGDRKALDRLKSQITEPQINIEQKYQPARSIGSVHRFFAASNHDHFAHVEMDDRRFVFLRVSDAQQQNTEYFAQLVNAINDPASVGAFVHYLEGVDLTSFDVRKKPKTNEHLAQKIKSLQGFHRYWYEVLLSGNFDAGISRYTEGDVWSVSIFIPTSELIREYTLFNKNAQRHQTVQSAEVVADVQKLCQSAIPARKLFKQRHLAPKVQRRGLQLPDLATARAEFEKVIGGAIQWI